MINLGIGLFNGIGLGIEHIDGEEGEEIAWCVTIDILCVRFVIYKDA